MTSSALSVIVSCRSARGGILDPVVLPPEGDAALVHGEQPAVWDRDALRVARQVASTASRPANGRLARPLTLIGAAVRATADELQLAGPMTLHQCFEEAAGRKKLVLHAIQNLPSCADPPPRTAPRPDRRASRIAQRFAGAGCAAPSECGARTGRHRRGARAVRCRQAGGRARDCSRAQLAGQRRAVLAARYRCLRHADPLVGPELSGRATVRRRQNQISTCAPYDTALVLFAGKL